MKKQIMLGMFGFIVIIFLFLASTSFYTVKTGEVAIVSSWGKVSRIDREGLNFKIPIVQTKEVVQASISKYTIEEFVSKRQELSNMIYQDLKDDFEAYGLAVSNVSITNHDFSMEYEKAIEAKKVAEQEVERTKFEQEKIRVEAENKVFLAEYKLKEKELQAKANEVEAASLSPVLLQKMALEKWDGKLPQVSGENTQPIIKLSN